MMGMETRRKREKWKVTIKIHTTKKVPKAWNSKVKTKLSTQKRCSRSYYSTRVWRVKARMMKMKTFMETVF